MGCSMNKVKNKEMSGQFSRIEDLANELWFEIFGYIKTEDLFMSFDGLNKRINELLLSINIISLSYSDLNKDSILKFFKVNFL
jgi:hypothetical protein